MESLGSENEPSGIRLMRLLDTHLARIVRQEHAGSRRLRLYGTGGYWSAFEQSACALCGLFPGTEVSVVTHPSYPFPVVMASISDEALRAYGRRHIYGCDRPDYKELVTAELSSARYRTWYRRTVEALRTDSGQSGSIRSGGVIGPRS